MDFLHEFLIRSIVNGAENTPPGAVIPVPSLNSSVVSGTELLHSPSWLSLARYLPHKTVVRTVPSTMAGTHCCSVTSNPLTITPNMLHGELRTGQESWPTVTSRSELRILAPELLINKTSCEDRAEVRFSGKHLPQFLARLITAFLSHSYKMFLFFKG